MRRIILIGVVCACVAAPALADVTVTETGVTPGTWVNITSPGFNGTGLAGIYNLNVNGQAVDSFCIDIWQLSPPAGTVYQTASLDKAPDPLVNNMGTQKAGYVAALLDKYWTATMPSDDKTAVQLAVWEIVAETSGTAWNLGSGAFSATEYSGGHAIIDRATAMLGTITTEHVIGGYLALTNDTYQDYVIKTPVPAAFLLGALGFVALRRKLRRLA